MTNLDKISHNLMDSNHRLKAKCGLMEKEIERLSEENDKLKQSYIQLEHRHSLLHDVCLDAECDRDGYHKDVLSLEKENEQLKSTIKEVTELLSDEVDLFSDKATEHDINAYVELKELDNKDAYYMATATKKAIKMLKELQE